MNSMATCITINIIIRVSQREHALIKLLTDWDNVCIIIIELLVHFLKVYTINTATETAVALTE